MWEYRLEHLKPAVFASAEAVKQQHMELITRLAKEGWELIAVTTFPSTVTMFYFKRQVMNA